MTEPETQSLNGMDVVPFEQLLAEARQRYLNAVSDAIDAEVARFILQQDRIAILHDAALFCVFLAALKCAEVRTPAGTTIETRDGIREWHPIKKQLLDKVPTMLVEWGIEARKLQLKGTAEDEV
jgi:hypothetical protein